MSQYKKPAHWSNPKNKLFPHQVGFTCPPHDFDAAPTDFLRIAPGTVGVHGRMLHVPDYRHELDQRKQNFSLLAEFVECMAKTIMSMFSKWPDFHEDEVGFKEQRELFDMICDRDGAAPPVLDSDDLLEAPHEMVRHWCEAVQIPFIASALSWAPGARDEVSWWDGGSFHANLRDSDGLKRQQRSTLISPAPPIG